MSHQATNWAIKQRGLKPSAKVVLWHLCDRYHPDHGCFPSLDTLADDCELSRRAVQDQIDILVKAGLVTVEKMERKKGQMPRNSYRFSFENEGENLGQNLPMAKSALGKKTPPPLANSDIRLGQNLPTNSVREPLSEPVTAREAQKPVVVVAAALSRREEILTIMGCDTSGIRPDGRGFTGNTNDQQEIPKWDALGLSKTEQDAKIREMLASKRASQPGFIPSTWAYFTAGMADLARAKKSRPITSISPANTETRDQRAARRRKMIGG